MFYVGTVQGMIQSGGFTIVEVYAPVHETEYISHSFASSGHLVATSPSVVVSFSVSACR